ncbi:MAG: hypothetical protein ACR2FV_11875 [Ornithinimicrobium sp.]|uniref:hypothetical protein n=1 Tax=Ornithinimicrobium sp. TaxID=1977084 RepID=UPI003D9BF78D
MYRPSTFGLIEFDAAQLQPAHQPGLRWLASWEGPAGGPSTQVTLGWADGEGCAVVVATSSLARLPHKSQRREEAVVQGLRRNRLPLPTAVSADQVEQAIERARTTADWHPSIVLADGLVCTGAVSTVHGVLVGHARVGTSVVTLAAVGLSADQIRFRTLACAGGYGADPLKSQPAQRVAEHRPELRSGG